MRIVYDDTMQDEMKNAVCKFMDSFDVKGIVEPEYGMDRVQMHKLRERLNEFLENNYRMNIGNTVTHAHGIGNNCMYPVYYHPETINELQQCGNINLNSGMFGEGFVSCEDYNGKVIGAVYEVRTHGIRKK